MTYASEVLADTPLGYWRLGEASGTTAVDASGNGRDLAVNGTPTWAVAGAVSGDTALTFDGVDDHAVLNWASWQNVASLTVEAWVKTTSTGILAVLDRDNPSATLRVFQFRVNAGKVEFLRIRTAAGATAVVTCASVSKVNDGNWHHVAATYDGSDIKVYTDGVLETTTAAAGGIFQPPNTTLFSLGVNRSVSLGAQWFVGTIDEAAYYGTALSATRIAAHYLTTRPTYVSEVQADSPALWWRLGEAVGINFAEDATPANLDGSYNDTYTLQTASLIPSDTADKAFGITVAPGGYVSLSSSVPSTGNLFSCEIWASRNGNAHDGFGAGVLMARDRTSASFSLRSFYVYWQDDGTIAFRGFGGSTARFNVITGVISNGPHHIVCTYDRVTACVYVDGVLAASAASTAALNSTQALTIGRAALQTADGLRYFNGVLDDFAFYTTALSATRVANHYARGTVTAQSLAIGRASETDEARALTLVTSQVVAIGLASEVDAARALTAVPGAVTIAIGRATEADEARALTAVPGAVTLALGQVEELDEARALSVISAGGGSTIAIGRASEVDEARTLAVAGSLEVALGLAEEVDSALGLTVTGDLVVALGRLEESDLALALSPALTNQITIGRASELDEAFPLGVDIPPQELAIGRATETDSLAPMGITLALATAIDAFDVAMPLTVVHGTVASELGRVIETEVSFALTPVMTFQTDIGRVVETDSAGTLGQELGLVLAVGRAGTVEVALGLESLLQIARSLGRVEEFDTTLGLSLARRIVRVRIWYDGEEKKMVELLGVKMGGRVIPAHVQYWTGGQLVEFEREPAPN